MISGHVFIATSLDGYIAREDGSIDWLLEHDNQGEDHGYDEFIQNIDAIIMGRKTFEKVLTFGPWGFTKPVVVLSKQLVGKPVSADLEGRVRFMDSKPADVMAQLSAEGAKRVYVDGGLVIQSFLLAKLIDDLIITRVPVLIGSGRSLFGDIQKDISLRHLQTKSFPSGLVQSHYRVNL